MILTKGEVGEEADKKRFDNYQLQRILEVNLNG